MTQHFEPPKVDIQWSEKNAIVRITGEIDAARTPQLQQRLLLLLDDKPQRIIVNLANVGYMDSAGLASFVKLLSRASKHGVELRIVSLSEMIKGLFEITRLDTVFEILDSEQEALE